jgi:multimeric flavodoxin WrbA
MKALILLGTLKKDGLSNTQVLSEYLASKLKDRGIECNIIKLVEHNILAGTYTQMGKDDAWPKIFKEIIASDIIIFATPVWWGNHSSEIQRVIERLDEIHDKILSGQRSQLEDKVGGIVITGDSDGAQHIIGNISNFFNALGIILPPYATLSVLWEKQAKDQKPTREELMEKYEQDYASTTEIMIGQFKKFAQM